jgi:hypothetical protein
MVLSLSLQLVFPGQRLTLISSLDGVSLSTPVNDDFGDFCKASDISNNVADKWNNQDNPSLKPERHVRVNTIGLYYKTITIVIMMIISDATIWSITYDHN